MAFYFSDKDGKLIKYAGLVGNDPTELNKKLDKELSSSHEIEDVSLNLNSFINYDDNLDSSNQITFGNKLLTKTNILTSPETNFSSYILNGISQNPDQINIGFSNFVSNNKNISTLSDLYSQEEITGNFSLLQHSINGTSGLPSLTMQSQSTATQDGKTGTAYNVLQVGAFTEDLIGGFQYALNTDVQGDEYNAQLQTLPGLTSIGYSVTTNGTDGSKTKAAFGITSFLGLASTLTHTVNDIDIGLNFNGLTSSAELFVKNETAGQATGLIIKDQKLYWAKYNDRKKWDYSQLAIINDIPNIEPFITKQEIQTKITTNEIEVNSIKAINSEIGTASSKGTLTINGDIIQNGSAYETHAEKVYTKNDYILLREGATAALASGAYSGLEFIKYDGTNNGRLVVDKQGVARVGDVGDEQPLATREEAPVDKAIAIWDASQNKFITNNNLKVESISNEGITLNVCGTTLKYTKATDTWEI